MKSSRVITILKTLSREDLKKFREYVYSPFFNTQQPLIHLIDYLYELVPHYDGPLLDKKKVYAKLYPGRKYYEPSFNNLSSDLLALLEAFLAYQEYERSPAEKTFHLLSQLRKRKITGRYQAVFKRLENQLNSIAAPTEEHFLDNYYLAREEDQFFMQKEQHEYDESLQKKADDLDAFYLIAKLKNSCEMLNRANMVNIHFKMNFTAELITAVGQRLEAYVKAPLIIIYHRIYLLLWERNNEQHFQQLKMLLHQYAATISKAELQIIYQYAQNYCTRMINAGKGSYLKELFSIYQEQLKQETILDNGILSHSVYKNIVAVAIRLEEYNWAQKFINNYKNYLSIEHRENAHAYNLAVLHYAKQEYSKALRLLQEVEFSDIFYYLDSKLTLLKVYYELEDFDPLLSGIGAVKTYLQRNKLLSEQQQIIYLNFVKVLKSIVIARTGAYSLKPSMFQKRMTGIRIKMDHVGSIANRQWLLEKIGNLMGID